MFVRLFSVLLLSILIVAGCTRPTEQQAEVTGTVTYKGKPLPGGRIQFFGDKGYNGIGIISPQGEYSLKSPLGKVQISVDNQMLRNDPMLAKADKNRLKKPAATSTVSQEPRHGVTGTYVHIPGRYADPTLSGLTFTVEPGSQTHNIELSDNPSATPGS